MDARNTQKKRRMEGLGAEIARLRQQVGMSTQADLKSASGVGVRTISDIESGKTMPRINTMRKIENALGLLPGTTDDYLDGTIDRLEPNRGEAGFYDRVIRDDFERQVMELDAIPIDERWSTIFAHRERHAASSRSGSSMRRTG